MGHGVKLITLKRIGEAFVKDIVMVKITEITLTSVIAHECRGTCQGCSI